MAEVSDCLVCTLAGCRASPGVPGGPSTYDCRNCGSYRLTDADEASLPDLLGRDAHRRAVLSHEIWKAQPQGPPLLDCEFTGPVLTEARLPSVAEQADRFVLYLGDWADGDPARPYKDHEAYLAGKIGALNQSGVEYIRSELVRAGLLECCTGARDPRLTFNGWRKHVELKRGVTDSRKGFMAMPFKKDPNDPVRQAYQSFRKGACKAGFHLTNPLFQQPKAGLIDDRLRVEIRLAKFVVADVTEANVNVYWEAGFAEGLGKKVIYSCEQKAFDEVKKRSFDTNHLTTVVWAESDLERGASELTAVIRNTFPADAKMTDEEGAGP